MWLKLSGSLIVIAVTTNIGFMMARRYVERPRQLRQIISTLTSLESYINYIALPLSEALEKASCGIAGPVKDLFSRAACILDKSGWVSPREAFAQAIDEVGPGLSLKQGEKELLLLLGSNLGLTNREEQRKYLVMIVEELQKILQESLRLRDQNVKMYRYLGVCGGLAIVILLV